MSTITKEEILKGLGDNASKLKIEAFNNGNFQVTIEKMGDIGDYDKICLLKQALDSLQENSVIDNPNESFRLSWKTRKTDDEGTPIFRPYPTIWVNQKDNRNTTTTTNNNVEEVKAELRSEMNELKALLLEMRDGNAAKAPTKKAVQKKKPQPRKQTPASKAKAQPESAPIQDDQGDEIPFGNL